MQDDKELRIQSFTELEQDWLGESGGEPITQETADLAREVLDALGGDRPFYPTPEGEVQIEWLSEDGSVENIVTVLAWRKDDPSN